MKKIVISILLVYVSCTLANSFVKRSLFEICALSRDQLSEFTDCLDDSLKDENRDIAYDFMECLGYSSIFDYLEASCTIDNADAAEDMRIKVPSCAKKYGDRLNTVIKKEDERNCLERAGKME
ncbi:uncharacterized protein LOC111628318 isoform X2 [Centruroides sculpturatus]|uniref:uncharacterized protein LOC111614412 n=1 Tax=Centruroides sculpturatus TaxID=218467 RepID=UPI000C6CBB76|nr:uncharacterized protein LOC111614412 [Centruroides sculpturatus]XP_023211551.1 uncharacterized protein LOC111614412 [Centruroides sculpturatus]XP_023227853.1 uncharacterized protein LOC111628318 isoform X2 [Centruroides sculpturatus]